MKREPESTLQQEVISTVRRCTLLGQRRAETGSLLPPPAMGAGRAGLAENLINGGDIPPIVGGRGGRRQL